jgi:glycine/D-amino acid oxidase-like deaminating enzyme
MVDRIVLGEKRATINAGGHRVTAGNVVLCTNGFADHVVVNESGDAAAGTTDPHVISTIGYMAAFVEDEMRTPAATSYIVNATIGGSSPYVYVTRRTFDRGDDSVTLTCMGGPETSLPEGVAYDTNAPVPGERLIEMEEKVRPLAQPRREPAKPFDFAWHGLMGYTHDRIRLIGPEPRNPVLLYNLGCNGIGFLPSIYGGHRIASILAGDRLPPSIFDPR